MELALVRRIKGKTSTIGALSVNGVFDCWVLEDVERFDPRHPPDCRVKVPHETAIPCGVYDVLVVHSAHFKCEILQLQRVPCYVGIDIHPGNTAKDTDGCLLPGLTYSPETVHASTTASARLFYRVKAAISRGERCRIAISSELWPPGNGAIPSSSSPGTSPPPSSPGSGGPGTGHGTLAALEHTSPGLGPARPVTDCPGPACLGSACAGDVGEAAPCRSR